MLRDGEELTPTFEQIRSIHHARAAAARAILPNSNAQIVQQRRVFWRFSFAAKPRA
jgi:hypothetical protein